MLIRQARQKIVMFVTIGIWYKGFMFQRYVCSGSHNVLMMSMNLTIITILNVDGVNYCCFINGIFKNEAKYLMRNINLSEKNETF